MEAGSGGSAFFPINDFARSRHCSASRNMRSTSTASISLSSEAGAEKKKKKTVEVVRSCRSCFLFINFYENHKMINGIIIWHLISDLSVC